MKDAAKHFINNKTKHIDLRSLALPFNNHNFAL